MRLPSLRICAYPDPSAHREGRYGTRKAERLAEAGDPVEGAGRDRRCGSAAAQPGGQQGLGSYPQEQSAEPQNKREIIADDKLKAVFGKDRCSMFEMNKHLSRHLS
jgi:chromatin remodeling complex protein RSC6